MERSVVLIALFAALIAALGLIPKIDLISGVPITAQSLGIMLAGAILGAKRGALSVLLFLLLVALGLPLLAGGRGGLGLFVSPTAGFLVGFPIAAFVTGLIVQTWRTGPLWLIVTAASVIGGVLVLYIPGVFGLSLMTGMALPDALMAMAPFVPGDLIKAVVAGGITATLASARPDSVLSRQ